MKNNDDIFLGLKSTDSSPLKYTRNASGITAGYICGYASKRKVLNGIADDEERNFLSFQNLTNFLPEIFITKLLKFLIILLNF